MTRLAFVAFLVLAPIAARAQDAPVNGPLLGLPGVGDVLKNAWQSKKAVGIIAQGEKPSIGFLVPIRTWHTVSGSSFALAGVGGTMANAEGFRPRLMIQTDASYLLHRVEDSSTYYAARTSRLTLPDIWWGPNFEIPLPADRVSWRDFKRARTWLHYIGLSVSLGI
jgi:hypothetical protein